MVVETDPMTDTLFAMETARKLADLCTDGCKFTDDGCTCRKRERAIAAALLAARAEQAREDIAAGLGLHVQSWTRKLRERADALDAAAKEPKP